MSTSPPRCWVEAGTQPSRNVVRLQLARFGTKCRLFAPLYRQVIFGRSPDSSLVAACTNPGALGGGEAALDGYFDAKGGTAMPMGPTVPWTVDGKPIATPMVRVEGVLQRRCSA